ncbi:uncharacterized protein LOC132611293 isoform X3 [Lycium barbarum]|uniref:uncharacterized protein LOC132611293 isoform X3 n=1 Tax=Lycium barbarum TaxID=112863 RepID=UPI00293E8DE9|nr:uncharacterized protein LOC132611293 isoform X3 [Lycium barbarum]
METSHDRSSSSSSTSLVSPSCSLSSQYQLPIGYEYRPTAKRSVQDILYVLSPTVDSDQTRMGIVSYVGRLIRRNFGVEVSQFGSGPLQTYLPHGDIDLTVIAYQNNDEDMAKSVFDLLKREELKAADFLVEDVSYIPAQVKIVKCFVQHIAVDISFNQVAGLCSLTFLEQVNYYIGRSNLFKHSIILIKAWCYYESRILGAQSGLISTYALEILVLHIINRFNLSLDGPLTVLYKFLDYHHTFDWENYGISIYGPVAIKCLQNIVETPVNHGNEMFALSKELLDRCVECSKVQMREGECKGEPFLLKYLNIVDPLKQCNNLGRSVSKGNFCRIRCASLPEEKVCGGLKKFFVNALELNSGERRPDVDARAMLTCARRSEVFSLNGDYNSHLNNQCYQKFGSNVPFQLSSQISPPQFQGNTLKTYNGSFYYPGTSSCIPTSCYPSSPQLFGSAFSANVASTFRGMELYNPLGSNGKALRRSGRGTSIPSLNGELELQALCPPEFVNEEKYLKVCRDFHDMHINKEMNVQSGTRGSEIDCTKRVELQGAAIHHLELGDTGIIETDLKEKSQETQICISNSNVDEHAAAQETNKGSDEKSLDRYVYLPQKRTKGERKSKGTLLQSNLNTG